MLPLNNAPISLSSGLNGYDPIFQSSVLFGHQTTPEQNTITTGTSSLVSVNKTANFAISQNFLTGTTGTFTYSNLNQDQNSLRNLVNPYTTSSMDLNITQHLLQGRGLAMNNRPIRIAKNNLRVNDLVFEQQVINTVANVEQLYWTLVSALENVEVAQQAVKYSQRLLDDNQKQVAVGTLAPVEVTRARAELAADNGALITAQTTVLQQEIVLKNALSRNGVAAPELVSAHVVPTDRIRIPDVEPVEPMQDLVDRAFAQRPEVKEARIQIDSARINIEGVRANMMPQVDAVADLRNNALSGLAQSAVGGRGHPAAGADRRVFKRFIAAVFPRLSELFRWSHNDHPSAQSRGGSQHGDGAGESAHDRAVRAAPGKSDPPGRAERADRGATGPHQA